MKRCNVCGAENEDVFTSCLICGAFLESEEKSASVKEDAGDEVTTVIEPLDGKNGGSFKLKTTDGSGFEQQNGYQNAGQPQGSYQNAGQPAAGYGQSQGSYQNAGQPAAGYGQPQGGYQNAGQPVPADKKKIFIVLGAITLVTALALVLIFAVKGGGGSLKTAETGVNSAEEVIRSYIVGIDTQDLDIIVNLCPPFADPDREEMESTLDEMALYNISCFLVGIDSTYNYTGSDLSDLEDDINWEYDVEIELEAACDITYTYNMSMSYMGESFDEELQSVSTVIKYQGKWFLYE